MLADRLTKEDRESLHALRYFMRTGHFSLKFDLQIRDEIETQKADVKKQHKDTKLEMAKLGRQQHRKDKDKAAKRTPSFPT